MLYLTLQLEQGPQDSMSTCAIIPISLELPLKHPNTQALFELTPDIENDLAISQGEIISIGLYEMSHDCFVML